MGFSQAKREQSYLRIALGGVSGTGKTYSSLWLAKLLAGDGKIAVIDSERGSSGLYAVNEGEQPSGLEEIERGEGRFSFLVSTFEDGVSIQEYLAKIQDAAAERATVLVVDSFSHSWIAALEMVDAGGGWVKAGKDVSPLVQKLVDSVLAFPGHVIVTFRLKAQYEYEKNEKGRITPVKIGMAPVARDQTDYEFSIWFTLDTAANMTVDKTRCPRLPLGSLWKRDQVPALAKILADWLRSGAAPSPAKLFAERMRAATSQDGLLAIAKELSSASLADEDRVALREIYKTCKAKLEQTAAES